MKQCVIAISMLMWVSIASAQDGLGTITGTVTDPDGTVVPGAPIQVKQVSTEIESLKV